VTDPGWEVLIMKGDFSRTTFRPEKHYTRVLIEQGRVQLDSDWNEQQTIWQHLLRTESADLIGGSGTPIENNGFQITLSADGKTLQIGQGRFYADGILCENETAIPYLNQPDLPQLTDPFAAITAAHQSAAVVYLDVWERRVTALDDSLIREVALNGTETSVRAKTIWQVKVLPVAIPAGGLNPNSQLPEWDGLIAGSTGMLNAQTQPTLSTNNPCLIPPTSGYQSLENQLYRVEIHTPGSPGTATFKWSRDNGFVETSIIGINGKDVVVHDLGPDDVLGFGNGQTVELLTDHHELYGLPGQLLTIDSVNAATSTVTLKTAPDPTDINLQLHPRMRRWDSQGAIPTPATAGTWIPLENGVQVQFTSPTQIAFTTASYATGDYWLIPARTATGEIEWPPFAIPNSNPIPQSPAGIRHHYNRLAMLQLNTSTNTWQLQDCRTVFPSLADVPSPDGGIHITGVFTVDPTSQSPSPLVNDTTVQLSAFGGINVQCDADADPASIVRTSCYLSVENPIQLGGLTSPAAAYQIFNLAGTLSAAAGTKTISWRPTSDATNLLGQITSATPPGDRGILMRLTLKGNFIWANGNPNLFLDGDDFGSVQAGATNMFLRLPSGDKRRGGDFEMWFWLLAEPATLSNITAPAQLTTGTTQSVTITLTDKAPAAGVSVAIAITSTPANLVATVPANQTTLTIPAGSTSGSFTIQAAANLAGQATITASAAGVTVVATVTVAPAVLTGQLVISPTIILVGGSATGTVTLSGPAPQAGVPITLSSANPAIASVPANVTVPAGSSKATFTITAGSTAGTTTIKASSAAGTTLPATITVRQKTKEGKDGKEVFKEGHKEFKEVETKVIADSHPAKVADIHPAKVADSIATPVLAPRTINPTTHTVLTGELDHDGTSMLPTVAFIRPEERPEVGQAIFQQPT
jgi:Family of unknown function (DUF6519)